MHNQFRPHNNHNGTDGEMTSKEREEQIINYIAALRSEVKSIGKEVELVKITERIILGFMFLGMLFGISICIYFLQL
tara:strand:- start:892 stop:1122 length:231 start_codon:yes stop_codon:yes gene_type:complete